jgi:DNA-binding NtrC family response regulator
MNSDAKVRLPAQSSMLGAVCRQVGHVEQSQILIIEDDQVVQEFTSMVLRSMGLNVACASSIADARVCFSRQRFHIVLCDIELPDGNGIELARSAADAGSCSHVLLASGWPEEYDEHPCFQDKRFSFLAKPFGVHALKATISTLLER